MVTQDAIAKTALERLRANGSWCSPNSQAHLQAQVELLLEMINKQAPAKATQIKLFE